MIVSLIILGLFATTLYLKEKCSFLERKIKYIKENFEDERKFHIECRELAVDMARTDERLKINNERLLKACQEFDEECKKFKDRVEKVK